MVCCILSCVLNNSDVALGDDDVVSEESNPTLMFVGVAVYTPWSENWESAILKVL